MKAPERERKSKYSPKPSSFSYHPLWVRSCVVTCLLLSPHLCVSAFVPTPGNPRLAVKAEMSQGTTWENCFIP